MLKSIRMALTELRAIKAILSGPLPQQAADAEKEGPGWKREKPE